MADSATLKRNKMGTVMEASPDDLVKLLLGSKADPADTPMGSNKRSPKELAELIKEIVGFEGDLVLNSDKPDGTMRKLMDSSMLKELGWKSNIGLNKGIEEVYNKYIKKNV